MALGITHMNPVHPGRVRVLALVLRRGVSGMAVLDGFGLAEHSARTVRLGRRLDRDPLALARTVERAARRFCPTLAVLALDAREAASAPLLDEAEALLRARGVRTLRRSTASARMLLLGRRRGRIRFEVPRLLAEACVPELRARLPKDAAHEAHVRPLWNAVALALQELVHHDPRGAAALLRPCVTFAPAFYARLRARELHLHPDL